jgi:hypothetical protein
MTPWTQAQLATSLVEAAQSHSALAVLARRLVDGTARITTAACLMGATPWHDQQALRASCLNYPERSESNGAETCFAGAQTLASWLLQLPWPEMGAKDTVQQELGAVLRPLKRKRATPAVHTVAGRSRSSKGHQRSGGQSDGVPWEASASAGKSGSERDSNGGFACAFKGGGVHAQQKQAPHKGMIVLLSDSSDDVTVVPPFATAAKSGRESTPGGVPQTVRGLTVREEDTFQTEVPVPTPASGGLTAWDATTGAAVDAPPAVSSSSAEPGVCEPLALQACCRARRRRRNVVLDPAFMDEADIADGAERPSPWFEPNRAAGEDLSTTSLPAVTEGPVGGEECGGFVGAGATATDSTMGVAARRATMRADKTVAAVLSTRVVAWDGKLPRNSNNPPLGLMARLEAALASDSD